MRIQIDNIKVNPGRRMALPEHIEELAKSVAEVGLLNPIIVDRDFTLIAGLHRLEAVKSLGWSEIECTVSSLEGLQAELAEIDENFVRCDLTAVEYGDLLLRRKEIYETLHPGTRKGQRNGKTSLKSENTSLLRTKSFTQDTADKLGIVKRTIERQIQAAKNLTPEARAILLHSDISKENLLKISRLEPKLQSEAANLFVSGKIKSMDDFLTVSSVSPPSNEAPAAETVTVSMYSAMDYKTSMFWCVAALVICCIGIILTPSFLTDKPRFYYSPDYEESYTVGDFDLPQIRKIYRLSPTDDPSYIPTNDFELNGWRYHMLEMDKEEANG